MQQVPDRPELADHGQLLDEILEREALARGEPAGQVGGLLGVEGLLGLLDQGEDVTQVEDPRRHPVRVEQVEVLELLPRRREHDRPAGQLHDGQCGAAPGVAVELGQDHAVVTDPVQEGLRGGHRVLADHRVDHEQDLVRLGDVPDRAGLGHHLLVDAQPAGGVDDDHIVQAAPGLLQRLPRDGYRVTHAVTRLGSVHRDPGALTEHLELLHGVGPLQVGGDQHRRVALPLQPQRELGRQRGFAGSLQASQHDDGRRHLREPQPPGLAAEDADQFLVHDLDDLLRRVQRGRDFLAVGPLLDPGDELPDDRERDVRLEQGDADLPRSRVDVGSGQPSPAAQCRKYLRQPVR